MSPQPVPATLERPAPACRPGLARRLEGVVLGRAFRLLGAAAVLAFVVSGLAFLRLTIDTADYWQHMAAIRTLAGGLLDPGPMLISAPYESHLYTPYHLFWGACMAAFGLTVWQVTALAGTANLVLLGLGCRALAARLLGEPRADVLLGLVLLVFWGNPAWWSGVYHLGWIVLQVVYPSSLAFALSLLAIAWFLEPGRRAPAWRAGFALLAGTVFLVHPITASFLLIFLTIKAAFWSHVSWRERLGSLAWVGAGPLAALAWPYFSVPALLGAGLTTTKFFGGLDAFYEAPAVQLGPALAGLAGLALVRRSRLQRLLAAALAVFALLYGLNYLAGLSHILSRHLIFIAFALQVMAVSTVLALRGSRAGAAALAAVLVAGAAFGALHATSAARSVHGLGRDLLDGRPPGTSAARHQYRELGALAAAVAEPDAVLMAPPDWAYRAAALSGLRVVAVPWKLPTMPDFEARLADAERFYRPETPAAARREILARRGAGYVLLRRAGGAEARLVDPAWRLRVRGEDFLLYAVEVPEPRPSSS